MVPVVAFLGVAVRGVIAGSIALSVFAILEPYAFLDSGKFIADLTWETDIARTAGIVPYTVQYVDTPKVWYELRQTTVWALGLPLGQAEEDGGAGITLHRAGEQQHGGGGYVAAKLVARRVGAGVAPFTPLWRAFQEFLGAGDPSTWYVLPTSAAPATTAAISCSCAGSKHPPLLSNPDRLISVNDRGCVPGYST